jgi:hypothetical protein
MTWTKKEKRPKIWLVLKSELDPNYVSTEIERNNIVIILSYPF